MPNFGEAIEQYDIQACVATADLAIPRHNTADAAPPGRFVTESCKRDEADPNTSQTSDLVLNQLKS
jgi:hypothetical protein